MKLISQINFSTSRLAKVPLLLSLPLLCLLFSSLPIIAQPRLEVLPSANSSVSLHWPATDTGYVLETTSTLYTGAAWEAVSPAPVTMDGRFSVTILSGDQTRFFRLRRSGVTALTTVAETSPAAGETGVAVTRETIFRFSTPLAPDTFLDSDQLFAFAGGRKILSRAELSGDRRTATLFYMENLPADARVEVTLDGTGVFDANNRPIDPDGDGIIGGLAQLTFETLSTVALATTGVEGRVFASEKNPDGSNRPLKNVTVTVDGMEETLRTTTDANGFFRLVPSPAGRFFVSVDGRTAEGSQWPGGAYYPFVGKAWDAIPGRTNNPAGGSGVVYLPLIQADALKPVSPTAETKITFAPSVLATQPSLAGVEVNVPANALFSNDGTRGGQVGIAPVPPERLPEPLPPGLNLPLVITIQTDGPSNFDQPVPVRFPNLPDPVTGVKLGAGEKTALWSFNHDTGRWEMQGSMTISADGLFAVSDPGVGVRQPGWHGVSPGSGGGGGGPGPPRDDGDDNSDPPPKCESEKRSAMLSTQDCLVGIGSWFIPSLKDPLAGCLFGIGYGAHAAVRDSILSPGDTDLNFVNFVVGSTIGCAEVIFGNAPGVGIASKIAGTFHGCVLGAMANICAAYDCTDPGSAANCVGDSADEISDFFDRKLGDFLKPGEGWGGWLDKDRAGLHSETGRLPKVTPALLAQVKANPIVAQIQFLEAHRRFLAGILGSEIWVGGNPADDITGGELVRAALAAARADSPGGIVVTAEERALVLAMPRPGGATEADVIALLDRLGRIANRTIPSGELRAERTLVAAARIAQLTAVFVALGWEHHLDGFRHALVKMTQDFQDLCTRQTGPLVAGGGGAGGGAGGGGGGAAGTIPASPKPPRPLSWLLYNTRSGFEQRGKSVTGASLPNFILSPKTIYALFFVDDLSGKVAQAWFESAAAGQRTDIPCALWLEGGTLPDRDSDGLPDLAERIVGSNADSADSDGDGLLDGVEVANQWNPADGQPLSTGVLATRDTPGGAVEIDTVNDFAIVADSASGLAVFDVANPLAPVLLSQIDPANTSFDAVATAGEFLAAIPGTASGATAGVHVFRISLDGRLTPGGSVALGARPESVVAAGRYAYAPAQSANAPTLAVVRLSDALVKRHVPAPGGRRVTALAIDGDVLWALSDTLLSSFRISGDNLTPLGELALNQLSNSPLEQGPELTAGNGRVFVGDFQGFRVIDGSNPTMPALRYAPPTTQAAIHDLALNGSGLILPVTSFAGQLTLSLSAYDIRNDRSTNFLTSFDTPGETRAVALHRGYALAADGSAGLATVNFLAPDRGTNPPTIQLRPFPSHSPLGQEADELFHLSTTTGDDVQVRDVEFYFDGILVGRSGKYPFATTLRAPAMTAAKTNFLIRAKATDTGGNIAWSEEIKLALLPDLSPPRPLAFRPAHGSTPARGSVSALSVAFDSTMALASLQSGWTLLSAGADGTFGTADDATVTGGEITFDTVQRTAVRQFTAPLPSGKYRARLASSVSELGGNPLGTDITWDFTIPTPLPVEAFPANGTVALSGTLQRFEVRFDERLFAPTVTPDSLRVVTTNLPNPIVQTGGVTSLSADGSSAVLEFPQPLANGGYRVVFTSDIRDVYGSPVGTNFPVTLTVRGPTLWTNDLSGLWTVGTNWNFGAAPITGDHVVIDRPSATPVVTLRGGAIVTSLRSEESFVLDGNTLTVREQAIFNGSFAWSNSVALSRGVIEWRGGATASGRGNKFLSDTTVRNSGVFEWRTGGILFNFPGAIFHNLPGGVFLINKAGPPLDTDGFVVNGVNSSGFLHNEGTLRKAGGTEASFFDGMGFLNTGLIDVTRGTLELSTATTNDGVITVATGSRLVFGPSIRGGTLTQLPSGRINGEGTISMEVNSAIDGEYDFDGTTSITATRVRFGRSLRTRALVMGASSLPNSDLVLDDGAVIGSLDLRRRTVGAGALRVLNPTVFGRLTVGGSIVVRPEADFQITNSMGLSDQARLENRTVGRLEKGGSITVEKDARLENMPGATLHLMDASVLQTSVTATHALLHNAGWIRKSIGTNEARILGAFANDGRVTVESGALSVESTGVHTGTFEMEAGTSLIFRQASLPALNEFTISSGIRGSAPVIFTRRDAGSTRPLIGIIRGELNVARLVVSNSKLFLSGGRTLPALEVGGPAGSAILELDGNLAITGELLLQGATLQPASSTSALTVRNGGVGRVINLTLPAGVTMLNQAGAQLDLSSSVRIESQALLHNQSGGTFTLISTNAQLSTGSIDSSSIQPGAFWNEGAFATATNGVHGLALNITNAGLMEIRSGAVEVSQGQLFQMGGELRLAGGELKLRRNTFTDRPPLVLRGGELTGHGSVGFSSTGGNVTITNLGCTIKPGLPLGVLNSLQRLTLQSGSVLEIELGGLTPGTEHDQLVVAEVLRMGGVLRLRLRDGYVPSVGDEFTVITFDSSSSTTFATIEGQNIGGGKRLEVFYQSSRVLVRCVAAP